MDQQGPVTWEDVTELLHKDGLRSFRIDIETDSTIATDEEEEKASRTEFLGAVGDFMAKAEPLAQAQPAIIPLLGEMLLFTVRGFRAGRSLEEAFETFVSQATAAAKQAASNPQPQPPDPKIVAAQMQAQTAQAEIASKEKIAQATLAQKDQDSQRDAQTGTMAAQLDARAWERDTAVRAQEHLMDSHLDASSKVQAATIDAQGDVAAAAIDHHATVSKAHADAAAKVQVAKLTPKPQPKPILGKPKP